MSRIRQAYERRFRAGLLDAGARRLDDGVRRLFARAERLAQRRGVSLTRALFDLADELRRSPRRRAPSNPQPSGVRLFWCDAGLGGLARWLWAAGQAARWQPGIGDDLLLRHVIEHQAVLLTTDSLLAERRLVRDGVIQALWLPPTFPVAEQLAIVAREFRLRLGSPRCMRCGGELRTARKEALQERIPPRTYAWLDEYFACADCDRLFWRGTHWQQISSQLSRLLPQDTQQPPPTSGADERTSGLSRQSTHAPV